MGLVWIYQLGENGIDVRRMEEESERWGAQVWFGLDLDELQAVNSACCTFLVFGLFPIIRFMHVGAFNVFEVIWVKDDFNHQHADHDKCMVL